jgi:K+ transporter
LLGDEATRRLGTVLLALTTLGFVTGGLGLLFRQEWWRMAAIGSAVFSIVVFLLFWDGKFQVLDEKGWVGILLNLAIIFVVFILKRPS